MSPDYPAKVPDQTRAAVTYNAVVEFLRDRLSEEVGAYWERSTDRDLVSASVVSHADTLCAFIAAFGPKL